MFLALKLSFPYCSVREFTRRGIRRFVSGLTILKVECGKYLPSRRDIE
jgi:hypothetical protein